MEARNIAHPGRHCSLKKYLFTNMYIQKHIHGFLANPVGTSTLMDGALCRLGRLLTLICQAGHPVVVTLPRLAFLLSRPRHLWPLEQAVNYGK